MAMRFGFGCLGILLYLMLMSLLFRQVGPNLVVAIGVAFAGGGLLILSRSFYEVYDRPSRPEWLWIPAGTVLVYLYFTYLRLMAGMTRESLLGGLLEQVLALLPIPSLTLLLLGGGMSTGHGAAYLLDSVLVGLLLPPLVLAARGFECEEMAEPEPAYLWYFHHQAFVDLRFAVQRFLAEVIPFFLRTLAQVKQWTIGHRFGGYLWPLFLMGFLGLFATALGAGGIVLVWIVAFALGLGLLWLAAHYVALLVRGFERAVLKVRAGYVKCPHANCHEPLPLPIFRCPSCGQAHRALIPGRYGIFRRRCVCDELLPTLYWFGKQGLPAECCHCGESLAQEMFGANLHFPIYGGPNAGKSTFLAATVDKLQDPGLEELEISWVLDRDRQQFETQWQPLLRSGEMLAKTAELLPDAFLLAARGEGGLPASLYLYDPAGEALLDGATLEEHHFIKYVNGLFLILDPLAFSEIWRRESEMGSELSQGLDPREVLDRVITQLENLAGLARDRVFSKPVAVIVTKIDLAAVAERLEADSDSETVRGWVVEQDASLVHILETRFREVRYFAVSALRAPQAERSAGVLDPLAWLCSRFKVLSRPRLTRVSGVVLEAAAGVATGVVGVGTPWLVIELVVWLL